MADNFVVAKDLYKWQESVFSFMGVWPLRVTYPTFILWTVYLCIHLSMEFADLFQVFGDLELMVLNLSESVLETMILIKMIMLRFSTRLPKFMIRIIDGLDAKNFEDENEREIYLRYNGVAKKFFILWFSMGTAEAIVYHCKPLEFRIKSALRNESMPFVMPYRTRFTFEVNDSTTFWTIFFVQAPMIAPHGFHSASIGFLFSFVLHVCGQMAILSFRIRNLNLGPDDDPSSSRLIFRDIVYRHRNIRELVKEIETIYQLILLEELFLTTVVLGLASYRVILNVDNEDKGVFYSCAFYCVTMLVLISSYCIAGEYLIFESTYLYDSYYHCQWCDGSISFKKQMIMCMIGSAKTLNLTAGGYYVFSLFSFTGILKTTAGYLSMLRTIG